MELDLSSEKARQLLLLAAQQADARNVGNIIQKLNKGRTLTKAEREQVEEYIAKAEANPSEPHPKYGHLPKVGKNKVEAAALLNIPHRSKFSFWRRTYPDAPPDRPNGTEDLWEWFDFIERHKLRGTFKPEEDPTEKRRHAEAKKIELVSSLYEEKLKRVRGETVSVQEMRRIIVSAVTELKSKLVSSGNVLAPKVALVAGDAEKCKQMINDHIWDILSHMSTSKYDTCTCPSCGAKIVEATA